MRFESLSDLYNFIQKLSALTGLTARLIDYKSDMKRNGMENHIHTYPAYLEQTIGKKAQIAFYDSTSDIVPKYIIPLVEINEMKERKHK